MYGLVRQFFLESRLRANRYLTWPLFAMPAFIDIYTFIILE